MHEMGIRQGQLFNFRGHIGFTGLGVLGPYMGYIGKMEKEMETFETLRRALGVVVLGLRFRVWFGCKV